MHLIYDKIKYDQRNIVDTTFSVVKRKCKKVLRVRKFHNQVKELKLKLIVYNVNKKIEEIICIKLRISAESFLDHYFLPCNVVFWGLYRNSVSFFPKMAVLQVKMLLF
jgi:hypothetical protein